MQKQLTQMLAEVTLKSQKQQKRFADKPSGTGAELIIAKADLWCFLQHCRL